MIHISNLELYGNKVIKRLSNRFNIDFFASFHKNTNYNKVAKDNYMFKKLWNKFLRNYI